MPALPRPFIPLKPTLDARLVLALLALYLIWGSTYLAIKIALTGFPPFFMAGLRFLTAGTLLYVYLRLRGEPPVDRRQWAGAAVIGVPLLGGGNGGVVYAEQTVSSGLAALAIATVPLWTVLFSMIWARLPTRLEWAGLAVGLSGMLLLNLEDEMRASSAGAFALVVAAVSWAFGSAWSHALKQPGGLMSSATQMLSGGGSLMLLSLILGEGRAKPPTLGSWATLLYLIVFGSLIAYTAYLYLLRRVRPALATSYAYVNPVVAVMLGIGLAGERIGAAGSLAMAVILIGVGLIALAGDR